MFIVDLTTIKNRYSILPSIDGLQIKQIILNFKYHNNIKYIRSQRKQKCSNLISVARYNLPRQSYLLFPLKIDKFIVRVITIEINFMISIRVNLFQVSVHLHRQLY